MDELFLHNRIAGLIIKYLKEEISEAEDQELQAWVAASPGNKKIFEDLTDADQLDKELMYFIESRERMLAKIHQSVPELAGLAKYRYKVKSVVKFLNPWLQAAAAVIIIFVAASMNKPVKSGEWVFKLPDSSAVWLNAESSIYCPATPGRELRADITGEAYFEVDKDAIMPYEVRLGDVSLLVSGTRFKVKTYEAENLLKVTMLQGTGMLVKGSDSIALNHGEHAIIFSPKILSGKLREESDNYLNHGVAWNKGYFSFNNIGLAKLMKKVSRWYDVEVNLDENIKDEFITGNMPLNLNVSEALSFLKDSGYNFIIAGKKVAVTRSNFDKLTTIKFKTNYH